VNTGAPPFEEWAAEWLHDRSISSSYTKETGCGDDSIWDTLGQVTQEVKSRDKTRNERDLDRQPCLDSINIVLVIGI
jgi:hypothetical protein